MKRLDRILQNQRINKARPFIPEAARVLDIGCGDGALFRVLGSHISGGLGIDPCADPSSSTGRFLFVAGAFPDDVPASGFFDVITMLAVLEHFPPKTATGLPNACARFLRPRGRLIITVPSRAVDTILVVLRFCRLVDAKTLEEHHGFAAGDTTDLFSGGPFRLLHAKKFQLGLNTLFVFERVDPENRPRVSASGPRRASKRSGT